MIRDLWDRRAFMTALAKTDLRGPNKNTLLGELWGVLDPLVQAAIYLFLFTVIRGGQNGANAGRSAVLIIGCVFLFSYTRAAIQGGGQSILKSRSLVLNSTFPLGILPVAAVYTGLLEFLPCIVIYSLIHLILPNARIINARRHPLDSCLGSYKQLFAKGQNFTYDMDELALYYRQYHEIMKHWHRVLPGKVLDVHYEETVGDLEAQVRRILEHCGLPFEDACLRFHETERPVRTASSEQVRQPLYARAVGTWRRYEKQLAPWLEELDDIIAELPDRVRNAGA